MKKPLITLLVSLLAWSAFAQESDASNGILTDPEAVAKNNLFDKLSTIDGIIDVLKDINGYIFLPTDEDRSVRDIAHRSSSIEIGEEAHFPDANDLTWVVANEGIASLYKEGNDIRITGNSFGETFLAAYNDDNVYYFAVFVCPTITVLSPTGVVYKYQKTYGQPVRIQFTQSPGYLVNCVMVKGLGTDGEWTDVTSQVEKGSRKGDSSQDNTAGDGYIVAERTNEDDGYYISDLPVTNNLLICISEESSGMAVNDESNGEVVGSSGVNLQVRGYELTFVNANDGTPAFRGKNLLVLDLANRANEGGRIDENGKYVIRDFFPGVHLIQVEDVPGYFRVVVQDNV